MADKAENSSKRKNGTIVARCDCKHTFQDKEYGAGLRLHNIAVKSQKRRCTVCSKETAL